ncbi:MAG: LD-carboxypeptidase [Lachnospiraceae bacterium]|nr:LD-carboxypeptidase [Lachnospiraceae bacterium]
MKNIGESIKKIGIVSCSNAWNRSNEEKINTLLNVINDIGLECVMSDFIYEEEAYFSGSAKEKADALNKMYADDSVGAIFDISGGDVANEVLEYLDYDLIAKSDKKFYGYSDLSTVINAIYTKTGRVSGLYQIRNLIYEAGDIQIENFIDTVIKGGNALNNINYYFIQEHYMEGVVIGGNIRCFLKLAGTEYMPDMTDKILLLEGLNTTSQQAATHLCQLRQMGAFNKIRGILLGTFTKLDAEIFVPSIEELVQRYAGKDIPIARTMDIGHGWESKCINIGENVRFEE